MKRKFLSALLACTLIAGSALGFSACSNNDSNEIPDNPLIPQIPASVKLTKVNEEDFTETLSKFGLYNSDYANSSNLTVKSYESYKETFPIIIANTIKQVSYDREYTTDLKYLNTDDNIYGQNLTYNRQGLEETYINIYTDNDAVTRNYKTNTIPADSSAEFDKDVFRTYTEKEVSVNSIEEHVNRRNIIQNLRHSANFTNIPMNMPSVNEEFNYKWGYDEIPSERIVSYLWSTHSSNDEQIIIGMLNGFAENGYGTWEKHTEMFTDETRLYITCSAKFDFGCNTGDYPFKYTSDDTLVTYIDLSADLTETDFDITPIPDADKAVFADLKEKALSAQADFAQNNAVEIAPIAGEFSEIDKCYYLCIDYSDYYGFYRYVYDERRIEIFEKMPNKNYKIENGKIIIGENFYNEICSALTEDEYGYEPYDNPAIQINCKLNDYSVILYLNVNA